MPEVPIKPELPAPVVSEPVPVKPSPVPTAPQTPAKVKLPDVQLQDTDQITGMTLGVKGVTDHSTQPVNLSKALNEAGFRVFRSVRPSSDLYAFAIKPVVSPGRDATNMVNSIKGIVESSGLSVDNDSTTIAATASGVGGYKATLNQLAGNYSIENIIKERNKKYGGGFNLLSLLKIGGLLHTAGEAGVFGRSSGKRKHRGIGGFFEGLFGGLFGRKKKDEPKEVIETPEKIEPVSEITEKPIDVKDIKNRDELKAYYEKNVKGKMHEEEYNKVDFDDDRFDIDILRDKIMKTEELNKQIEPKPKPEIPVKPELPAPVVSEPVSVTPAEPEPVPVTPEPKPVKRVPVPDSVNDAIRKYFDKIRKQPPIGGGGIDPLKLARTTINSSNLADSSTGTKGVIPSFFDQAASKYGKHIKQIDVNNDDEIKAALDSGKELIAGGREFGGSSLFSDTGHYVNMKGIGGGSVEVRDPSGVSYVTDINNLLPGIRNPEGPNYMGQVGGGASDFDMEEVQKKINDQEKKNKQNLRKFGAGSIEGEVQVTNPNASIGDNYVSSTMSTDTNELLEAVRSLNIKPEMSELITYVKMLVSKQDDIVTTLTRYGGGHRYGGGSDSPTSSHDSQTNSIPSIGYNTKPDNPNGRKPGSIKVDQKKNFENAMKIARAAGFS